MGGGHWQLAWTRSPQATKLGVPVTAVLVTCLLEANLSLLADDALRCAL